MSRMCSHESPHPGRKPKPLSPFHTGDPREPIRLIPRSGPDPDLRDRINSSVYERIAEPDERLAMIEREFARPVQCDGRKKEAALCVAAGRTVVRGLRMFLLVTRSPRTGVEWTAIV